MIKLNIEQPEITVKEQLQLLKQKVHKFYPGAVTRMDIFKKFYVVTETGFRIVPDDANLPNTDTVIKAWKQIIDYLDINKIITINNNIFNSEAKQNALNDILAQE